MNKGLNGLYHLVDTATTTGGLIVVVIFLLYALSVVVALIGRRYHHFLSAILLHVCSGICLVWICLVLRNKGNHAEYMIQLWFDGLATFIGLYLAISFGLSFLLLFLYKKGLK